MKKSMIILVLGLCGSVVMAQDANTESNVNMQNSGLKLKDKLGKSYTAQVQSETTVSGESAGTSSAVELKNAKAVQSESREKALIEPK